MQSYFIKTPSLIPLLFPNQIWSYSKKEKTIYLTFDDGPTPDITNWILDTLQHYNAKATFFCIGKNIEKYPKIFHRISKHGHIIGNHTYNHEKGWKTNTKIYIDSVLKTEKLIQESKISNLKFQIFRPPYGKIKPLQSLKLIKKRYQIIMWSVLSGDFDTTITAEKCLDNVINNTENGSILVFHDSKKAYEKLKYVLPKALAYFTKKGYTFKYIAPPN